MPSVLQVDYVRLSDPPYWAQLDVTDVYFDLGVTNDGDEVAQGYWFEYTAYDPSGKEGTSRGSMLYELAPGATEHRHQTAATYGLPVGRNRIHVRIHDESVTYFEEDFYVEFEPPPAPPPSTGSLRVNFVRLNDPPYTAWQDQTDVNFEYGSTNEGDEPTNRYWFHYKAFTPDGQEGTERSTMLDPLAPGASENRFITAATYGLPLGRNRIHVQIHNESLVCFEDDFYVEFEPPPAPPPATGSLVVNYVEVADPHPFSTDAYGTKIRIKYGVTNEGDVVASRYWIDWNVIDSDGHEGNTVGEGIPDVAPGETADHVVLTNPRTIRPGQCRVHVRIYSETAVLYEDDLYVDITEDVPIL